MSTPTPPQKSYAWLIILIVVAVLAVPVALGLCAGAAYFFLRPQLVPMQPAPMQSAPPKEPTVPAPPPEPAPPKQVEPGPP